MIKSPQKNVADTAWVKPVTSSSPVGRTSNWATEAGVTLFSEYLLLQYMFIQKRILYIQTLLRSMEIQHQTRTTLKAKNVARNPVFQISYFLDETFLYKIGNFCDFPFALLPTTHPLNWKIGTLLFLLNHHTNTEHFVTISKEGRKLSNTEHNFIALDKSCSDVFLFTSS